MLGVRTAQPNYQFRCPRCGHPIAVFWGEPLGTRDMSTLFAVECLKAAGGCGVAVTLPGSYGWPVPLTTMRSRPKRAPVRRPR